MPRKLLLFIFLLALSPSIGLAQTLTYPAESTPNVFSNTNQFQIGAQMGPQSFANLPGSPDGTIIYCADCQLTNPCTAGGTGGFAQRTQGQWQCQASGGGGGGGTPCSITSGAIQYNAGGNFGCVNDFTAVGHAIVGGPAGVLNLSAMSPVTGFSIPSAASALPTLDSFVGFNITVHAPVYGSNGNTLVFAAAGLGATVNTTCTNQVLTAISGVAPPTCSPLTGAFLPVPSVSTLGGVQSITCPGGLFLNAITTAGVPVCNTPAGSGNVSNVGTPTNGQIAQWTSATTLQGIGTTGTGNAVLANTPTLANPILGVATATSLNNVIFTAPATSATFIFGVDGSTFTMQGTDTYVGRATTDTLTHKTFDTAGTGNVFKINGVGISTVTGTGAAVLATSPSLVTPALGAATATSINGLAITTSTGTLTITNGKTLTISNSLTFAGTDATTQTFPTLSGNVVTSASSASGDLGGNYPAPTVNAINLAISTHGGVTGILPIANGGTGASTLAAANIPVLNASNTFTTGTQDFSGVTQIKLPARAGFATLANGEIGYDTTNKNWHVWQNGVDLLSANFSGAITTGHCPQISVSGGVTTLVDSGSSNCGGGGSTAWDSISNAAGALTLANAGFATTFNQTSAVNWTWANTTSATLTTPQNSPIININGTYWTGSASAADVWTIQNVLTAGSNGPSTLTFAHPSGTSGALNVSFPAGVTAGASGGVAGSFSAPEGTALSGVSATDILYAGTSSTHRLTMNNNNAGALLLVGVTSAGTSAHCAQFAANGIDIADSGAACGGVGTVTSVGFTGGLISVATATSTPALTVAGTSGGVPFFSSASTWATSAVLASGQFVLGGGAGSAPNTSFSIVPVANGGTNLASGTSGGVLAYTATGVLTSSAALAAGQFVLGGGAGVVPSTSFSVVPVANGGTNLASGTSGGILAYTATGVLASSAALTANAIVKGGGAGVVPLSGDLQDVSNVLSSITSTQGVIYQGGVDASANSVLGGVTVRGASETGAGGATSAGGEALYSAGDNAATNAASQAGSSMFMSGKSTGATQGLQGLNLQLTNYVKGTTATQWNLQCEQAAMQVQDCGATPTNWLGIAELVGSNTIQMVFDGQTPINASAAVTLGDTVCAGATAGKVTDSGGAASCTNAQGATVGVVMATAGTWTLRDGTSFTATTTLPLIHINPAALLPAGGGSTAFSALTGSTNTTAAMIIGTGASLAVSGSGTIAATTVSGNIPLNQIVSATGAIATLANGNNPFTLNCAQSTNGQACATIGETTASANAGTIGLQLKTLTTSKTTPLDIAMSGSATAGANNAAHIINISGAQNGGNGTTNSAGGNGADFNLITGAGGTGGATTGNGGNGGLWTMVQGNGGTVSGASNNGGTGGGVAWTTGNGASGGASGTAGNGGDYLITLGVKGVVGSTPGRDGLFKVTGTGQFTGSLTLGTVGSVVGSLLLANATSGSVNVHATTGALGAADWTVLAGTDTFVGLTSTQTLTNKTLTTAALGSSTATTQTAKDNSTKVATTAYVDANTPLTAGTSVTLTGPRQYFICTGTCTITVPVPAAGNEFCVLNTDNVATVITMSAIGSSARYENTARTAYGTAGTGTFVSGGAVGDKVCLLGLDSTHYLTASFNGTWTAN